MTSTFVQPLKFVLVASCIGALLGSADVKVAPTAVAAESAAGLPVDLGTINFPNSGSDAAQSAFLTGVKAFHSFEFEDAGEAFLAAQKSDPSFALAYWGEAMSFNHPLWAQQDKNAALATLKRFAPTPKARSAKTPAGRERGLMEAVDILYGEGDKLTRDIAYSEAMQRLHETYPEDDEIATLYALSLLGTVRPGDKGFKRQMQAGAIALQVYERNPNHPGAAHFIIHAFDDPEHAILALPAARRYAEIAPDATHALHMPSHIFVQLGMWDGVVKSNDVSYKAALDHAERKNLERGRSEFHALSWYQYGQLQLGNIKDAKWALEEALRTEKEFPTNQVRNGAMMMLARYILETERWDEFDFSVITERDENHAGLHFVAGLSAVKTGDLGVADAALSRLQATRQNYERKPATAYMAKIIAVGAKELESAIALAGGSADGAEAFLQEATTIEATLNAPSGPPLPMKPSFEMYGEFLLDEGRFDEAAVQFKKALERTPNRTKSVHGLEKAMQRTSDTALLQ